MNDMRRYMMICEGQKGFSVDSYLHGYCHLFALCMNEITGFPIKMVIDHEPYLENEEVNPNAVYLVHAFNVRPDGSFVDASGTITEQDAIENYGEANEPETLDIGAEEFRKLFKWFGKANPAQIKSTLAFISEHIKEYSDPRWRHPEHDF